MKTYKFKSMFIMFLIVILSIAGCSNSPKEEGKGSGGGEQVELEFFHRFADGANKIYFDEAVKKYENQNPNVKIKVSSAVNDDYKQKINVLLGSNNPPDVFFSWAGEYAEKFVRGGHALDLTEYTKEGTKLGEQVIPTQFEYYIFDDKTYGVPIITDGKQFFYNKEIYEELNLEEPETWNEFIDNLKKIKDEGYTPLAFGNQANWSIGHYLTTLNQNILDPEVLAKDYNPATGEFTDPGYVEALKKVQELQPYFSKEPNAIDHDAATNAFVNAEAAHYYNQFGQMAYMEPAEFEWDWFNFPTIEGAKGDQERLTGSATGFMVSSKTKHPEEAIKFLEYLTSKEEAGEMVKKTGMISSSVGGINEDTASAKLIEASETINNAPGMNNWLDNMIDARIAEVYLNSAQMMLGGEKTPEEVMQDVQEEAEKARK